ncbi:MAG: DUF559 domain-containing protein [Proteobacteria bacterium]|nr:DUF559 domain-containing protein [Pseudomonadota bacterium]
MDRQRFEELARSFIKESSDVHASESDDPKFGEYLKVGLDLLLKENLEFVFKFTESPIETIFVNSLVLAFIKGDPLNLVVQHSVKNAPGQIEAFRKRRANFKEFITWYETKNGSIAGVDEYLHQELARGKMEAGEHHYLWRHLIFYEWFGLEDRFHMILQPGLPNVRVEGRAVRPDLLFWIPSDESIKIIVECDGFQYHKEKAAFVHDRKRDRVLKASGYEVLRYSGTEIYADPIAAGADLAEYLWSKE